MDELFVMNGWMICDVTSFSTVFQSYQNDVRMVVKGCVQWKPVYGRLVGCFWLNGPLRQYFSLYRAGLR